MQPEKRKLTEKQNNVYRYVRRLILERGYGPTVREIADNFGVAVPVANGHIHAIMKKGYLSRKEKTARSFELEGRAISGMFFPVANRAGSAVLGKGIPLEVQAK